MADRSEQLLQEFYAADPWKSMVGCILLNLTNRKQVEPMVDALFDEWPQARDMAEADESLEELLKPLGLQNRRAATLRAFSKWFRENGHKADINTQMEGMAAPGIGEYARDSWIIFIVGPTKRHVAYALEHEEWPADKELARWFKDLRYHAVSAPGDPTEALKEGWAWKLEHPGGYDD
jgi:adenine-specific DNA glycosylase